MTYDEMVNSPYPCRTCRWSSRRRQPAHRHYGDHHHNSNTDHDHDSNFHDNDNYDHEYNDNGNSDEQMYLLLLDQDRVHASVHLWWKGWWGWKVGWGWLLKVGSSSNKTVWTLPSIDWSWCRWKGWWGCRWEGWEGWWGWKVGWGWLSQCAWWF